jgi:hypothetical protein
VLLIQKNGSPSSGLERKADTNARVSTEKQGLQNVFDMYNRRMLEKRLRALETRVQVDPVILTLSDGTSRKICGSPMHTMRLLRSVFRTDGLTPAEAADRELLRSAITIKEPRGFLLELAHAILNSP